MSPVCEGVCPSVTATSSHSFEARGLKFTMHNHCTYTTKFTDQIFEFLSTARVGYIRLGQVSMVVIAFFG